MDYRKLSPILEDYKAKGFYGKSESTRDTYVGELFSFDNWLDAGVSLTDITFVDIQQYMDFLKKSDAKASTIKKKFNAIKHFCNYIGKQNEYVNVKTLKVSNVLPAPVSLKKVERNAMLREAARKGARDYAIICFMLYTGVRVNECVNVELRHLFDIGEKKGFVRIVGKGSKERVIPLNHTIRLAISLYLKERGIDFYNSEEMHKRGYEPLFVSNQYKALSRRRLQQIVEETGKINAHALRHTFATMLLRENNTDPVTVTQLMGHSSLNVLQRYTQATLEERLETLENLDF